MRRITSLSLAAVVVGASAMAAPAYRSTVPLDGRWDRAVTQAAGQNPPDAGWQSVDVPGVIAGRAAGGAQFAWYRRTVAIPAAWQGRRVFLFLGGARFHPHVFVDGKAVADRLEGWTPFEVELTAHVQPGKSHQIAVRCQDWSATFTKGFTLPKRVQGDPRDAARGHVLAPIGGHYGYFGIWDATKLLARPAAFVDDVSIVPSVRKRTLAVSGACASGPEGMVVQAEVLDAGAAALSLPMAPVGKDGRWATTARFAGPRMWSPEDPHLYMLRLTLRDRPKGKVLDVRDERFGFRELWAEGADFYLNGVKRHLLATSTWPSPQPIPRQQIREVLETIKAGNNVAFRMHTQPWQQAYLEEADEVGLMMVEEAALWTRSCFAYKDPRFWRNYKDHVAGMIRRDRNHACLVMWSLENELLFCGASRIDPNAEQKLADVGRFAKALDPHHLITFESDLDPGGAADVIGLHYPHEMPAHADYPNTGDWLSEAVMTGTGGGLTGTRRKRFQWERKKPLYIGEYLWVPTADYSPGSVFFGDDAYRDLGRYKLMAKAHAWVHQTLAYRRAGVSGLCPWTCVGQGGRVQPNRRLLYETQKRIYEPVAAFVRDLDTRFFAGDEVTRRIDVFNDSTRPLDLELRWTFGEAQGAEKLSLPPAGYQMVTVKLPPVQTANKRVVELKTDLMANGDRVHAQSQTCTIEPRGPITAPAGVRIVAYDPQGKLPRGLAHRALATLDALSDADPQRDLVVIGPQALAEEKATEMPVVGRTRGGASALQRFLAAGGRMLVLEQDTFAGLPLGVSLKRHASTMTFPVAADHPVLAGVSPDALKFWRSGHYVSHREVRRPAKGGGRTLVVSGGSDSVGQGPVVEMPAGRGTVLLCQALVAAKLDVEPAARRLLQNALDYLASMKPRSAKTVVVCDDDRFVKHLTNMGLEFDRDPAGLADADILVLHAGGKAVESASAAIRLFAAKPGRTVYWHAPEPDAFERLRDALGCGRAEIVSTSGPVSMNARSHPLLMGVCREDLVYVGAARGDSWKRGFDPDPTVTDRCVMPGAPAPSAGRRLEAETMALEGRYVSVDRGRKAVSFATNGTATGSIDLARDGLYRITLIAGGTPNQGIYPLARIRLDGEAVADVALSEGRVRPYVTLAELPSGRHDIAVAFVNDTNAGGEDRNMVLDAIIVDREPLPKSEMRFLTLPPSLAVRDSGGLRVVVDGIRWDASPRNATKGRRYASTLLGNLGARFTMPEVGASWVPPAAFEPVGRVPYFSNANGQVKLLASGTVRARFQCAVDGEWTVVVRGRSDPALGEFGKALVSVDGREVGEVEVASRTPNEFTVGRVRLSEGVHTVALKFTNDVWRDGHDRNLYVMGVGLR